MLTRPPSRGLAHHPRAALGTIRHGSPESPGGYSARRFPLAVERLQWVPPQVAVQQRPDSMRGVRIAPLIALVTTTRFEGADKVAKACLLLRPQAHEFKAELLLLCPPNHGLVNLHRELRSTHDVDAQLEIRPRVYMRGTSNLTAASRQVAHDSDPGEVASCVDNGAVNRKARGLT